MLIKDSQVRAVQRIIWLERGDTWERPPNTFATVTRSQELRERAVRYWVGPKNTNQQRERDVHRQVRAADLVRILFQRALRLDHPNTKEERLDKADHVAGLGHLSCTEFQARSPAHGQKCRCPSSLAQALAGKRFNQGADDGGQRSEEGCGAGA